MFLFLHRQPHKTQSTAPRLNYLLFHRDEYETTELSSACEKVVSANLMKYEDIYI